jgi:hypothetical protein
MGSLTLIERINAILRALRPYSPIESRSSHRLSSLARILSSINPASDSPVLPCDVMYGQTRFIEPTLKNEEQVNIYIYMRLTYP